MRILASVVPSAAFLIALLMAAPAVPAQTADDDEVLAEAALLKSALKPWTGDLDGMVARNMIRVAIPYGIATSFLDGPPQKGVKIERASCRDRVGTTV